MMENEQSISLDNLQSCSSSSSSSRKTDYTCCIICQHGSEKQHNVTAKSLATLKRATNAWKDRVWERLSGDLEEVNFLEVKKPKWHRRCRNKYLLKKSYELAEKKRNETTENANVTEDVSEIKPMKRRSMTPVFEKDKECVICCKTYQNGKQPTSLVSTKERQISLYQKAKELDDQELLMRIQGYGDQPTDMIALGLCYHRVCMNRYTSKRVICRSDTVVTDFHELAFKQLVKNISIPLLENSSIFMLNTLHEMYLSFLRESDTQDWENFSTSYLKTLLLDHYKDKIVFFPLAKTTDLVCSSSLPIGLVLMKLKDFEGEDEEQDNNDLILNAAEILRESAKKLKSSLNESLEDLLDVSIERAKQLVPKIFYIFTCQLLSDKRINLYDMELNVDSKNDKSLILAQQLLHSICSIRTPLSVGVAFDIYNSTRSKSQITKMNHLQQCISYDSFQRILTTIYNDVISKKQEKGIYVPPNMKTGVFTQFAVDNIDWRERTCDGSTFHATSSIIIQPPNSVDDCTEKIRQNDDLRRAPRISRKRTVEQMEPENISSCHLTTTERKKSRCLSDINNAESLMTGGPEIGLQLLFLWSLGRVTPTQLLNLELDNNLPGFSAFCAQVSENRSANEIGYLPLIPSSPTDPGVVKTAMTNLVILAKEMGMSHTIITCDQAVYEIAYALRKKFPECFENVILMLGGFHLAHNFIKAIAKIMRKSGAEDILVAAEVLLPGTANRSFGDNSDYYQSLHALTILYEIMFTLQWEAMEAWCIQQKKDVSCIKSLSIAIQEVSCCLNNKDMLRTLHEVAPHIRDSMNLLSEYKKSMSSHPTHKVWSTFLEMMDILLCFLCAQRDGNWSDYLDQAGRMLPYLIAAGHNKYGVYLSLHLKEMKELNETAPYVHENFAHGNFTVFRASGRHNGVSPDMVLEQTYNADVKQKQGLCGISLSPKARTKWLYTKPVVADIVGKLKRILHLDSGCEGVLQHHASSTSFVYRDMQMVQHGLQIVGNKMANPFKDPASDNLICISTGLCTSIKTQEDMTQVKQIGEKALKTCLEGKGNNISVRLSNFESCQATKSAPKAKEKPKPEINLLQRVSQVLAAGGKITLTELVGEHECTDIPPSLFDSDGCLRKGNKSTLLKVILDETGVNILHSLPAENSNTAVIVDAMYLIHRLSFTCGETFQEVSDRYFQAILLDVTARTSSIHFCCDRYDHKASLKAMERVRRRKPGLQKQYDIQPHLTTPTFRDFISAQENKAALMCFLSENWSTSPPNKTGDISLYLTGGFPDETKTVMVNDHEVKQIPELSSTHEEADNRIILQAVYSAKNLGASRIIIHANDTDIVVLCIYYFASQQIWNEIFVRTEPGAFLPIHEIANSLGREKCLVLPFFHAFSGKDDTSFLYGLGKKKLWRALHQINSNPLSTFAENFDSQTVNDDLIKACKSLVVNALNGGECSLANLRTQKFLAGKSGLLLSLPPTDDALEQHIKRAALATITSKSSHIPIPVSVDIAVYGWQLNEDKTLKPVYMTKKPFPANIEACVKCKCKRKCAGNCACTKNNVPCFSGCFCQGKVPTCSRAIYMEQNESDSD